jgi:hypothetical protein
MKQVNLKINFDLNHLDTSDFQVLLNLKFLILNIFQWGDMSYLFLKILEFN